MKYVFIISLLAISLFGYKDSFYLGAFTSSYNGKATMKGSEVDDTNYQWINTDFTISGKNNGIRWGEDTNQNREHTSKMRLELSYEPRVYTFENSGQEVERKGHRVAASMYLGKNLDLLLTHETTLFFKLSFGYTDAEILGKATDETFGVGAIYTTRIFDFQIGIDREFRRWGALIAIPYDFFDAKNHQEATDNVYGGINVRF